MAGYRNAPTRRGYPTDQVVSALQKAVRRGDIEAAVYWAVELDQSGKPGWAVNRLRMMTSEDVGMADPIAVIEVNGLLNNWETVRKQKKERRPERMFLIHAVMVLAQAQKSRAVDNALIVHYLGEVPKREIPDEALDQHTQKGRAMGRSSRHFAEVGTQLVKKPKPFVDPFEERARSVLMELDGKPKPKIVSGSDPDDLLSQIREESLEEDWS